MYLCESLTWTNCWAPFWYAIGSTFLCIYVCMYLYIVCAHANVSQNFTSLSSYLLIKSIYLFFPHIHMLYTYLSIYTYPHRSNCQGHPKKSSLKLTPCKYFKKSARTQKTKFSRVSLLFKICAEFFKISNDYRGFHQGAKRCWWRKRWKRALAKSCTCSIYFAGVCGVAGKGGLSWIKKKELVGLR